MNKAALSLALASLLSACGGGGGGGGGGALPPTAFTSFAAIPAPGTVQMSGITVESSYTADTNTFAVTSVGPAQSGTGTVTRTYDGSGTVTALSIAGSKSSFSGGASTGSGGIESIASSNATSFGVATGSSSGFNYQSYGIWETGRTTGAGTVGAISAGATTPDGSIPTSGTATFNGGAIGFAVDAAGSNYATAANSKLDVNFGTRTVGLSTNSTTKLNMNTAVTSSASDLNLSGVLTYAPATNSFNGAVSTTGGYTGTATGRFYGPAATEAGGTFSTKGTGLENYGGAFGAKR